MHVRAELSSKELYGLTEAYIRVWEVIQTQVLSRVRSKTEEMKVRRSLHSRQTRQLRKEFRGLSRII